MGGVFDKPHAHFDDFMHAIECQMISLAAELFVTFSWEASLTREFFFYRREQNKENPLIIKLKAKIFSSSVVSSLR